MIELAEPGLIFDWNGVDDRAAYEKGVELADETLRDGLQSPSVIEPPLADKIELLHLMVELGIDAADIGLPGRDARHAEEVYYLAKEIADQHLPIQPYCAARTLIADLEPIVEISERAALAIECATFIGSSPIRRYAEGWGLKLLLKHTEESIRFIVKHGLPALFVTEDTTRTDPDTLRRLYRTAIECGARRICVSDTVGHATPAGVRSLLTFIKRVAAETGEDVKIDWHGHQDRGLSIENSLAALAAGADRIHGCALGIGERCGNTPLDILLVNLNLMGILRSDLRSLPRYIHLVSRAYDVPVPRNYPMLGADAFRTSSGVHAAAIIKAREKGDHWLANRVYSSVPAEMFGLRQTIEIGPMSGAANARYWLREHCIEPGPGMVDALLSAAKRTRRVLTDSEILALVQEQLAGVSLTGQRRE